MLFGVSMNREKIYLEQRKILEYYAESYNNSESEFVKQLIFIDTIFLSLSPFLLFNFDFISALENIWIYVIVSGWTFFASSIVVGVWIYQKDINFYGQLFTSQLKIVEFIESKTSSEIESINEIISFEDKKLPNDSASSSWMWVQFIFSILGILCITIPIIVRTINTQ